MSVEKLLELNREQKEVEARLEQIKQELKTLKESLLEQWIETETQSIKQNGYTCYLHRQIWASVPSGDSAALEALKRAGLGYMIKEQVNSQTLSAYIREQTAIEQPLPAELEQYVKISEQYDIRIRKA